MVELSMSRDASNEEQGRYTAKAIFRRLGCMEAYVRSGIAPSAGYILMARNANPLQA